MTDHPDAVKVLESVLQWAEARCPCENEEPNPCPLCGASVENLEPCKSAENTLPRHLLKELRSVKARAMQAAMPAPAGVRVRKLEWVEPTKLTNGCWSAECELGVFSVAFDDGWHAELNDGRDWEWEPELDPRSYEGPYAAQRACQAYRDARILSAIEDAGAREGAEPQGCPTPGACSCPPSTLTPAGDLVERLREPGRRYFDGIDHQEGTRPNRDGEEAADTIEVLQAMVETEPVASTTELTVLIENLLAIKNPTPRIPNVAWLLLKRSLAHIKALEAEVARLRQAVRNDTATIGQYEEHRQKLHAARSAAEARATTAEADLAALKSNYDTAQANWDLTLDRAEKAEADLAALRAEVERKDKALRECSDKLWIARCDSQDAAFRAAAEAACAMAATALATAKAGG